MAAGWKGRTWQGQWSSGCSRTDIVVVNALKRLDHLPALFIVDFEAWKREGEKGGGM